MLCFIRIDATPETIKQLGRLVNHLRNDFNMTSSVYNLDGRPRIILSAIKAIEAGEQLFYDYGDRNPESVKLHPWLLQSA
jgi:histone-lysine N-methyltransferase SETD8